MRSFGYNDKNLVPEKKPWTPMRCLGLALAILMVLGFWFALDQKLLLGGDWMSETYDNPDWRTNEGNLHTFGAWDIESHIWKTEHIMEWFPNFHWNPYWYLGMPLVKYYQSGFYYAVWGATALTGFTVARAALMLIIFAHLAATLLTFLLCYKISRRVWVSALCSVFLLANTFISLRSYGWEPITVVFLWLFPLGLLLFFQNPTKPFRFWLVLVVGLAYLCHPLIWFSLLMTMGLYLFSLAIRRSHKPEDANRHYIWQYFGLTAFSILLGAVQFIPQFTYVQASSGAHMGVTYLPFYQIPFNIITLWDFLFDAGNLKGPGPIIMIALFLLITFAIIQWRNKKTPAKSKLENHELIGGLAFVLFMMVLFYYLELYNLFPMNLLRSIQYHRIIPEFIIVAAALVAALYSVARTYRQKIIYYTILITFVAASTIIIYNVQTYWQTTDTISDRPEFITDNVEGRITHPYTDQSLAVRSSFQRIPQVYGYYEQGITNAYNDELFSVSSGYHNAELTVLYLKAANVGRLYVNNEEGERDAIVAYRMNHTLEFVDTGDRYSYFVVPLADPSFSQTVSLTGAARVQEKHMGCREMFKEHYCGSVGEEFVATDPAEIEYLNAYVTLLEDEHPAESRMVMRDPDHYDIRVLNADEDTGIVVKMTFDHDFEATIDGKQIPIEPFGPDFMLLKPRKTGDYSIVLEYHTSKGIVIGAYVSLFTLLILILFGLGWRMRQPNKFKFRRGDM